MRRKVFTVQASARFPIYAVEAKLQTARSIGLADQGVEPLLRRAGNATPGTSRDDLLKKLAKDSRVNSRSR
jgi:hypothetical protein